MEKEIEYNEMQQVQSELALVRKMLKSGKNGDRVAIAAELSLTYACVDAYLNGRGTKLSTAKTILDVAKRIAAERNSPKEAPKMLTEGFVRIERLTGETGVKITITDNADLAAVITDPQAKDILEAIAYNLWQICPELEYRCKVHDRTFDDGKTGQYIEFTSKNDSDGKIG